MWTKDSETKESKQKLSREILEMLVISLIVAGFIFAFLYYTSVSIGNTYLFNQEIALNEMQEITLYTWIRSVCFMAALIVFISLFLFLFSQKITYILCILKGVETLQEKGMDFVIPLEGNDELTELAKSINYLSQSQREIQQKEREMKEEREQLIRSLSHDIRTPLTSLIAYSEYVQQKESLNSEEIKEYIALVQTKSEQIKVLTDQLLGKKSAKVEYVENGKLLIEQLVLEWEEWLEDEFCCEIHLENCEPFHGNMDISDLHRIFDNLASNIEKYAAPEQKVELWIEHQGTQFLIVQRNGKKTQNLSEIESHKIGINSIKQIAKRYDGSVKVIEKDGVFEIQIDLKGIIAV